MSKTPSKIPTDQPVCQAPKIRSFYRFRRSNGGVVDEHLWAVVTGKGGVHLTIRDYGPDAEERFDAARRFSGGLEFHWRSPPSYMKSDAPDHEHCWLLKCPCWHDGTSSYPDIAFIPHFDPERPLALLPLVEQEAIEWSEKDD